MNPKNLLRLLLTGLMFAAAVVIGLSLWRHYQYSPWTRDGRIKADVIAIAPDVSGTVTELLVQENQRVQRGAVLLRIDAGRYHHALAEAEAAVSARKADYDMKRREAARRAQLSGVVVSSESREAAASTAASAAALYQQAQAARDTAALNLKRTEVLAPVDGYVTNLEIHAGDYANIGRPMLALVDANSFRVNGYFEETKLPYLHEGDPVRIRLMSGGPELRGHVEGISRGITDRDNPLGPRLLADVNPTFNWVRLAQRVPVRIRLAAVPESLVLVSGMTCTVIVEPAPARATPPPDAAAQPG